MSAEKPIKTNSAASLDEPIAPSSTRTVFRAAIVPTENFVWSTLVPAGTHVTMPLVAGEITIRQPRVRPIMEVLAAKDCGTRRETASAERLTDRENHVRKSVYNSDALINLS
jgi:hypothetical protein